MSVVFVAFDEFSAPEQSEVILHSNMTEDWLPANGGTENPFVTRSGIRLLYCWQPSTGRHAYLNCDTDMFMKDDEAAAATAAAALA